jgi:SLT domain-containing protein
MQRDQILQRRLPIHASPQQRQAASLKAYEHADQKIASDRKRNQLTSKNNHDKFLKNLKDSAKKTKGTKKENLLAQKQKNEPNKDKNSAEQSPISLKKHSTIAPSERAAVSRKNTSPSNESIQDAGAKEVNFGSPEQNSGPDFKKAE